MQKIKSTLTQFNEVWFLLNYQDLRICIFWYEQYDLNVGQGSGADGTQYL